MLLPIAIAVAAHLLGALLGLGGRLRSLPALHTFAVVSALAVVLAQLLPDALDGAGLWALPVFALGTALPWLAGRLSGGLGRASGAIGLELGYLGLLVHQAADGLALGTYGGEPHAGHGHADVLFALSVHTVPMVALVALAYQRRAGWAAAARRVLGLLAATIAGAVATNLAPAAALASVEPWITAAVSGLLLHVVAHDWDARKSARGARDRLVDLLAVAAGVGLVLAGGHQHHDGPDLRHAIGDALLELSLETAPALLFGLVAGALLCAWGPGRLSARWFGGGPLRQAAAGASMGAPLPICACGVLPLAQSLRARGAGAAFVVAFLIATPELGIETFVLTGQLLGWPFAIVRLASAVLLAVIAALAVHRATRARGRPVRESLPAGAPHRARFRERFVASFDELVHHVAPWTVVGLIAAAYVQATLGDGSLGALLPYPLELLAVTAIAVPSYVCAASATPLAAVLVAKGMSPGVALVGLLLGPATNLATVGFLRASYGARGALAGIAALVLAAWGLAIGIDAFGLATVSGAAQAVEEHAHGWPTIAAAALLALALLRSIWRAGLRAWLASLGEAFGPGKVHADGAPCGAAGGDAHGDCCAHDHLHAHPDEHGCDDGHLEGCGHDDEHGHGDADGHGRDADDRRRRDEPVRALPGAHERVDDGHRRSHVRATESEPAREADDARSSARSDGDRDLAPLRSAAGER